MVGTSCIQDIKADFLQTMLVSEEFTLEKCKKISFASKIISNIVGLFASLL
jgi:hypothetical protein